MESNSKRARALRRAIVLAAVAVAATLAFVMLAGGHQPLPFHAPQTFAWLRPAPVPSDWHVSVTRSGARLPYPASWRKIETDRGTASAAPARGRRIVHRLPERHPTRRR